MSYYDTIEEDLARAKAILAKGKPAHDEVAYLAEPMRAAALGNGGAIWGADIYVAYKLLESFVAEIERLRLDQRMLADTIYRAVVAIGDVEENWEGTVEEGVALMNTNIGRVSAEITARGEIIELYERQLAGQDKRIGLLLDETERLRGIVASHEEELGELQPKYIAAVNRQAAELRAITCPLCEWSARNEVDDDPAARARIEHHLWLAFVDHVKRTHC